jgi:hypothetical protein
MAFIKYQDVKISKIIKQSSAEEDEAEKKVKAIKQDKNQQESK